MTSETKKLIISKIVNAVIVFLGTLAGIIFGGG